MDRVGVGRSAEDDKEVVDQGSSNMEHCIEKCCNNTIIFYGWKRTKSFPFFQTGKSKEVRRGLKGLHRNRAMQQQNFRQIGSCKTAKLYTNRKQQRRKEPRKKPAKAEGTKGKKGQTKCGVDACLLVFQFLKCRTGVTVKAEGEYRIKVSGWEYDKNAQWLGLGLHKRAVSKKRAELRYGLVGLLICRSVVQRW